MISEELKGIVDKFKEQGKMDFLEETTEEKISDFEKERSVKLPTKFKELFQKYRQKENLDTVLTIPQSEAIVWAENYRCSVNDINKHSTAA